MTEFAMGPSVAPALHPVPLRQHLRSGPALCDAQGVGSGGYTIGEKNLSCLTNLADSGGYQWPPTNACQWMRHSVEDSSDNVARNSEYGFQEPYCAVARQPELSSQNEQKSDWSDESKSGDADEIFLSGDGCKSFKDDDLAKIGDGRLLPQMALEYKDSTVTERKQSSYLGRRKNNHDQSSPECGQSNLKQCTEKLGWKSAGRHAENRRKRWAQADPLLDFWKAVSASRYAAPFRRPVALLEDYNTVIRQPMDLSTIRRQLESDENYSLSFLQRDLTLMVTNALIYNKKGTEMHEMGLKLKCHAMKLFEGRHKEASYPHPKLSRLGSSSKCTNSRHLIQPTREPVNGNVPLALVKKHRTVRRPRLCLPNVINGLRSDMGNGTVMDSSSEEEAAAVLICFSSGQSGDDKQALATSKAEKSESPRKKSKFTERETGNMSACSGTWHEGLFSHHRQVIGRLDVRIMSASSIPIGDSKSATGVPEKQGCPIANEASQTKEFEKQELSRDELMPHMVEAAGLGGLHSERSCMGLKHKWQERWRIQSAASFGTDGSLQQPSEPYVGQPSSQKSPVTGDSASGTKYRPFLQVLQT